MTQLYSTDVFILHVWPSPSGQTRWYLFTSVKKAQLADTPATEQSAVEQFFVCLLPVQTATNTWRLHNLICPRLLYYGTVHFNYSTFNHDSGQTVEGQISHRQELNQSVLLDLDFFPNRTEPAEFLFVNANNSDNTQFHPND